MYFAEGDFVKIFRIFGVRESLRIVQAENGTDLRELRRIRNRLFGALNKEEMFNM